MDTNSDTSVTLALLTGEDLPLGISTSEIALMTAAPAKAATKAPAQVSVKNDILPPDPVSKAVFKIENLEAKDCRDLATELLDGSEFSAFQLGGVFSVVNKKKYFAEYGFTDFKSFVEATYGIKYRKAMYLADIYEQVVSLNLPWDKIKGLGWTKLKTLLNPKQALVNAENVDEWVAQAQDMTVLQLESLISAKGDDQSATEQDGGKTVTTMTFKLHADQKASIRSALERAKEMAGTQHDTVALEMIAADFMGKPIAPSAPPPSVSLEELMKSRGHMDVLEAFEKAFPTIDLSVTLPDMG